MARRNIRRVTRSEKSSNGRVEEPPAKKLRGRLKKDVPKGQHDVTEKESKRQVSEKVLKISQRRQVSEVARKDASIGRGRNAKAQAVKKMASMKKETPSSEEEDDDDEIQFSDESDDDDDDFEVSPPSQRSAKKKKKIVSKKDDTATCKKQNGAEDCAEQEGVNMQGPSPTQRYIRKASEEAFLSLSESDSSSDEDISDALKQQKPKQIKKAPEKCNYSAPKSLFDDIDPTHIHELNSDEPGRPTNNVSSMFDDDMDVDSGENLLEEKHTQPGVSPTPSVANGISQGAIKPSEQLTKAEAHQSSVQVSLSDGDESEESEGEDFEETPPNPVTKQDKRRPARGRKEATKVKMSVSKGGDDKKSSHLSKVPRKRGRASSKPTSVEVDEENNLKEFKGRKARNASGKLKENEVRSSPAKRRRVSRSVTSQEPSAKGRKSKGKPEMPVRMEVTEMDVKAEDSSSDDSQSDWEEVEDTPLNASGEPTLTPKKEEKPEQQSLEIDIDLPGTSKSGKKKREYNWASYFQWQVNKYNKERQLKLHKAHLVLLMASCFHSNRICNTPELQCLGLSLVPMDILSKKPKSLNVNFLAKVLSWFRHSVEINEELKEDLTTSLDNVLPARFERQEAASERELVHMFAIILRSLGADVRLIFSLHPITYKAKLLTKKFKQEHANSEVKKRTSLSPHPPQVAPQTAASTPGTSGSEITTPTRTVGPMGKKSKPRASIKDECEPAATDTGASHPKVLGKAKKASHAKQSKNAKNSSGDKTLTKEKGKQKTQEKKIAVKMDDGDTKDGGRKTRKKEGQAVAEEQPSRRSVRAKNINRRSTASKIATSEESEEEDAEETSDDNCSDYEEELKKSATRHRLQVQVSKINPSKQKSKPKKNLKMNSSVSSMDDGLSSDSDFQMQVMSVTKQPRKPEGKGSASKKKVSRKVLSSDSEESVVLVEGKKAQAQGSDCWIEVYLPSEKRWVCVDCVRGHINKDALCEKQATNPITYLIGVENDGCATDVTKRYASRWMTETHKLRPDEAWWEGTLRPYRGTKARDKKEQSDVQSNLENQPLPKSIGEYKNHPLYALKRHLLKFEALYPASAAILGYCRGEAVYARDCVHTLHTRETWLKEGKAIIMGEKPYKMVKPRPKWKRGVGVIKTDEATLGVFGEWQIEDYVPPPAVNGKVPRNEYGNVELFKPTMLPAGTVHLKIPGLNRVARKLAIDCAPAMMGWDFSGGNNHPVMEGFVVCEEHVDTLVAAWEEEKALQAKKEKEKREARAMKNWKLMIKSLLIRERLDERYQKPGEPVSGSKAGTPHPKGKGGKRVASSPVKASWPENKMTAFQGDQGNLLPFEKKASKRKK